jgi:hypothetical protein
VERLMGMTLHSAMQLWKEPGALRGRNQNMLSGGTAQLLRRYHAARQLMAVTVEGHGASGKASTPGEGLALPEKKRPAVTRPC